MTPAELDTYLRAQHTCRVATIGPQGEPRITPLWFVWDGEAIWLYSLTNSQRWANLERDARCSVLVDDGTEYGELRGVEIHGRSSPVGEVPHQPAGLWADKYRNDEPLVPDGKHAWLRIQPGRVISWDFGKLSSDDALVG